MLSSTSDVLCEQVERQQAGHDRASSWWRGRRTCTSVHFFTGLIDRAYAAGRASSRTRTVDSTLAVIELTSDGQGRPRSPEELLVALQGEGATMDGGLVAASASEWNEVSTIHRTGG